MAAKRQLMSMPGLIMANQGQMEGPSKFLLKDRNVSVRFEPTGFAFTAVRDAKQITLRARFVGGRDTEPRGSGEGDTKVNYFLGERSRWRSGVPTYRKIVYADVWPGIDVIYEPRCGGLEYSLVVSPGADPAGIRLSYEGTSGVELDEHGNLILRTAWGKLPESRPRSFQGTQHPDNEVASCFALNEDGTYGFAVGDYDRTQPLVIDPTLLYSSFLGTGYGSPRGGDEDIGKGIAVNAAGEVFVIGDTKSDFPTTPGALNEVSTGGQDAFVTKVAADGASLLWSTYLGGSTLGGLERGNAIALDTAGDVYVTGYTTSGDFPTTAGAYDTTYNGSDIFVAKFNGATGALSWSTYFGGTGVDEGLAIAVDSSGNVFLTGTTWSTDFPTSFGAYDTTQNSSFREDVFVTKLNAGGATLGWSTYLGGDGYDYGNAIVVDSSGNAYVAGTTKAATVTNNFPTTAGAFQETPNSSSEDAFVTRVNAGGGSLGWSTYLGGTGEDFCNDLQRDAAGKLYLTGYTGSADFPVSVGAYDSTFNGIVYDAFVAVLNAGGDTVDWATYLGGTGQDHGHGLRLDSSGNVYVGGRTWSTDFPVTAGALDATHDDWFDLFIVKINTGGATLSWSTYLGGEGSETPWGIEIDTSGNVFLTGQTYSNFPTTAGAFNEAPSAGIDCFVTKVNAGGGSIGWSTLLGGGTGQDYGKMVTVDALGNAYVTGYTESDEFPTTPGAFDRTFNVNPATGGAFLGYSKDVFVTKLNPGGAAAAWSTYLGGGGSELPNGLDVDQQGNVYVTGRTTSLDFPTTAGALSTTNSGGITDAFVTKLDAGGGALSWSTFLGGTMDDYGMALRAGASGDVFVTGFTTSTDFPTTPGAFDETGTTSTDAFVMKIDATGATVVWSTFLGGWTHDYPRGIAVDSFENVFVAGYTKSNDFPTTPGALDTVFDGTLDGFVTRINAGGGSLGWSTFLGGTYDDEVHALALDSAGDVYVTGETDSSDFPTTGGAFRTTISGGTDSFAAKLNGTSGALGWSTYLGGTLWDLGWGLAVDSGGSVVVTGQTSSTDFPTTGASYDTTANGAVDAFVTKLNPGGATLAWSTYLGGAMDDKGRAASVDAAGTVYVTGETFSADFPSSAGAYDPSYNGSYDVFVTRFGPADPVSPATVVDLSAAGATTTSITLSWTAPGDDGNTGTATQYEIRYSQAGPITDANWASATPATGVPSPAPGGSSESFTVTGLTPSGTYWFALRARDEIPNQSGTSNSPQAVAEPPPPPPPSGGPPNAGSNGRNCGLTGLEALAFLLLLLFWRRRITPAKRRSLHG